MMYGVYFGPHFAGHLASERGRMTFAYSDEWAAGPRHQLSVRMPVRREPYDHDASNAYFANLLPEDEHKRLLASVLGASARQVGPLLGAIGGECAGAVSIWPEGSAPDAVARYEPLSDDEIAVLMSDAGGPARRALTREGRLSLPGGMDKIALRRFGSRWERPVNGAPTTHILKWAPDDKRDLSLNEHFTLELLRAAGLPTVETEVLLEAPRVLVIRRDDRVDARDGGGIALLHQEDFCQASAVDPALKYQSDGGPSIVQCAKVVRECAETPAREIARLLDWTVAGFLTGNMDGHAKNLALMHVQGGISLAPFFDMSCSAIYRQLKKMAMTIGGEYRIAYVQSRHWQALGVELGVRWRAVHERATFLSDRIEASLPAVRSAHAERYGDLPMYDQVERTVRSQLDRLRRSMAEAGRTSGGR